MAQVKIEVEITSESWYADVAITNAVEEVKQAVNRAILHDFMLAGGEVEVNGATAKWSYAR